MGCRANIISARSNIPEQTRVQRFDAPAIPRFGNPGTVRPRQSGFDHACAHYGCYYQPRLIVARVLSTGHAPGRLPTLPVHQYCYRHHCRRLFRPWRPWVAIRSTARHKPVVIHIEPAGSVFVSKVIFRGLAIQRDSKPNFARTPSGTRPLSRVPSGSTEGGRTDNTRTGFEARQPNSPRRCKYHDANRGDNQKSTTIHAMTMHKQHESMNSRHYSFREIDDLRSHCYVTRHFQVSRCVRRLKREDRCVPHGITPTLPPQR